MKNCALCFLLFIGLPIFAQIDTTSQNYNKKTHKKRLNTIIGLSIIGKISYANALYHLWYKDFKQSSFHLFDDKDEWLQVDKAGHIFSSYWLSYLGNKTLLWSQMEESKAILWGSAYSLSIMTMMEVFDGFSNEWGFSLSDMASNITGISLFAFQQHKWKEQKIKVKYSYQPSHYAKYRPKVLGNSLSERLIKDYNSITYWLSINLSSILNQSAIPKWINLAIGYGADAMITGKDDPLLAQKLSLPYFKRFRQFYLSLDVDFSKITLKKTKCFNAILQAINIIKIPFPTIEYNKNEGFKFIPLYF